MNILDRPFGCEIEISTDFDDAKPILKKILDQIYKKPMLYAKRDVFDSCIKTNKWHLKIDNSTMSEICTPISTFKDISKICKVAKKMKQNKIKITHDDSFHIHVHSPDVNPRNVLICWLQYESVIKDCFPERRRTGDYSMELIPYTGKRKKNISEFLIKAIDESENHHSIISFSHYEQRKTIEFRISEGTLNPEHIRNWVKFCIYFIQHSKKIDPLLIVCDNVNDKTLYEMIDEFNIKDKQVIKWLTKRHSNKKL